MERNGFRMAMLFKSLFVIFVIGMFLVQVSSYAYADDDHEDDHGDDNNEEHESYHESSHDDNDGNSGSNLYDDSYSEENNEHSSSNRYEDGDDDEYEESDDDNDYNFVNDFEIVEEPITEIVYENITVNDTLNVSDLSLLSSLNSTNISLNSTLNETNITLNQTEINQTAMQLVQKPQSNLQLTPLNTVRDVQDKDSDNQEPLAEQVDNVLGSKKSSMFKDFIFKILSVLGFGG